MDCRTILRVSSLARMTALVSLSLISLNLVPRAACAQDESPYRSLMYFGDSPPPLDVAAVLLEESPYRSLVYFGDSRPPFDLAAVLLDESPYRSLMYFGDSPPPFDLAAALLNANAADSSNADQLWPGGGLGLDLTGTELIIAIAGDGLEWQHAEVNRDYLPAGSRDFGQNKVVPEPRTVVLLISGALGLLLLLWRRNGAGWG